jgi:hypothetical protein
LYGKCATKCDEKRAIFCEVLYRENLLSGKFNKTGEVSRGRPLAIG